MTTQYTHANGPLNVFKLTRQDDTTRNNTQWGPNITNHDTGNIGGLGIKGWLHFYTNPITAILLKPIHANFQNPTLWKAKAEGIILLDKDFKGGSTILTTINPIPLPNISDKQRVEFAALLALEFDDQSENSRYWKHWFKRLAYLKPTTQKEFLESMQYTSIPSPLASPFTDLFFDRFFDLDLACAQAICKSSPPSLETAVNNFFQTQTQGE